MRVVPPQHVFGGTGRRGASVAPGALQCVAQRLHDELGRSPRPTEIADRLDASRDSVVELMASATTTPRLRRSA